MKAFSDSIQSVALATAPLVFWNTEAVPPSFLALHYKYWPQVMGNTLEEIKNKQQQNKTNMHVSSKWAKTTAFCLTFLSFKGS